MERGGRRKLSVVVEGSTYDALETLAKPAALTVAALVSRLAAERAGTSAPAPTSEELGALVRSNYELRAVGKNVNQIARSLNAYPGKMTHHERADLQALAQRIDAHVRLSAGVLQALKPARQRRAERILP